MRNGKLTYEELNGLVEGKESVFFKTHEGFSQLFFSLITTIPNTSSFKIPGF